MVGGPDFYQSQPFTSCRGVQLQTLSVLIQNYPPFLKEELLILQHPIQIFLLQKLPSSTLD